MSTKLSTIHPFTSHYPTTHNYCRKNSPPETKELEQDVASLKKLVELFLNIAPNTYDRSACNTLINACIKANDLSSAFKVFLKISRDGVEPNISTYDSFVNACAQANELEKVYEIDRLWGRPCNYKL